MSLVKNVGRGVDTLVLNVCYADKKFLPVKQELSEDLQNELNLLQSAARLNEAPVLSRRAFKGINLFMQEKGSRGQWRWILKSPLLSVAISRGRLSRIIAQVRFSSEHLWFQVSQVDLCADVIGWDVSQTNWQECFISGAVGDDRRPRESMLCCPFLRTGLYKRLVMNIQPGERET